MRLLKYINKKARQSFGKTRNSTDVCELRRFIGEKLDPGAYLDAYPDVADAGVNPFDHWIEFGLKEGRQFPGLHVKRGAEAENAVGSNWNIFYLENDIVATRLLKTAARIPQSILKQIDHQSRYENAVYACGAHAVAHLRQINANDLYDRDGLDLQRLFSSFETRPYSIIVIPFLVAGGAEKYSADLFDALQSLCATPVLVIVTEQNEKDAIGWRELSILKPFHGAQMIYWKDLCSGPSYSNPDTLARFLNSLRPNILLVVNSRVGLDAVAQYGRGLSQFARIACAFFSLGLNGRYPTYGVAYPRRVLPFAIAFTDNEPMAKSLDQLYGPIPGQGIRVIPPCLRPCDEQQYAARIGARLQHLAKPSPVKNWLWISRVEPLKGTSILAELASARQADIFHVFGPLQADADGMGLIATNIQIHDLVSDVPAADFTFYNGFVFTSLFEGMPNIVLEMSQHAIPMVLAEVGGLKDTFNEEAVVFVKHLDSAKETAGEFSNALDRVISLSPDATVAMATAARAQALARHSPNEHRRHVAAAFLQG